jgi:hypothetical protein
VNDESILSEAHVLVIDYLQNGSIIPRKVEIFRSSIVKFRPLNGLHTLKTKKGLYETFFNTKKVSIFVTNSKPFFSFV